VKMNKKDRPLGINILKFSPGTQRALTIILEKKAVGL